MSLWPNRGDADPRPAQGQPYAVLAPVRARRPAVPVGFPVRVEPVVSAASAASASRVAARSAPAGPSRRSADRGVGGWRDDGRMSGSSPAVRAVRGSSAREWSFSAPVWRWREGSWRFVTVPEDVSDEVDEAVG